MNFTSVKLSNNALNFLLAQYHAIFKRAYVKGLAAAVIVTAGMAAGSAQAIDYNDQISSTLADAKDITLNNGDTINFANSAIGYQISGYVNNLTINAGGTLSNADASNLIITGTLTLNDRGTITLTSGGLVTPNSNVGGTGTFDAILDGTVNLNGGILQSNNLSVGHNAEIVIEGKLTGWSSFSSGTSQEFSQLGGGNAGTGTEIGTSNIAGQIIIGDYGQILAYDDSVMNLNEGATISFRGTSGNSAIQSAQGATLNINGAIIETDDPDNTVTTGIKGAIYADTLNINSGRIIVASGDSFDIKGFKSSAHAFAGDNNRESMTAVMNGGAIENAGTINLGAVAGDKFTVNGGDISNAASATFAVGSGTAVTLAGGTFANAGTATLASGASLTVAGCSFTNNGTITATSGSTLTFTGTSASGSTYTNNDTITIGSGAGFTTSGSLTLAGNGTINFQEGATGISLGGENVVLNNKLILGDNVDVNIAGKITFNGDGQSGDGKTVDITGNGDLVIGSTGTLIINDAASTIGLTFTSGTGTAGDVGTFSSGTGFAGFDSGSTGILYIDVAKVAGLNGLTINNSNIADFTVMK